MPQRKSTPPPGTPAHTVLIQEHPKVIITIPREQTGITNPDQTTIGQITIPVTHQEIIQEEVTATVHTAPVPPLVQAKEVAVTADV